MSRFSWNFWKARLWYPLLAEPVLAKAVPMLMVVMLNDPLKVGGAPYMYWMLLLRLSV